MCGEGSVCGKRGVCMVKGGMCGERGACMAKGGGMCGKVGACVVKGDMCGKRGHVWQGGTHGRRNGHCSGRYAFYWNAFLFKIPLLG